MATPLAERLGRFVGAAWRSLTGGAKAAAVAGALSVATPQRLGDEVGISGTANFAGEVIAESNHKLLWNLAHGTPGVRQWGEWEKARRTDEAVAKSLNHVLGPVRDSRVDVEESKDNPNAKAHADFIRECIKNVSPGWSEFLTQSLGGALMSGFGLHEECWSVIESKHIPGGKGMAITKMAERLPNSVKSNGWNEAPDGDLESIEQLGPRGSRWENVSLPASKVFLNSWDRSGNNYLGYSAYRPVWYLIQIRAEIAKIIGVSMVREGAGIPIAVSQVGAEELSAEARETLQNFIENCVYHENAGVIMPRGWDLKWLFSPTTSRSAIIEAYNHLGLLVMSQVGAQQLYLGTSGTGSRSVGEVHDATSIAFIQGCLSHMEDLLNGVAGREYTGWVRKQIDFTFGPQSSYPRIRLTLKKPQLPPKDRFEAAKVAKEAGIIKRWTDDDENVAREELGFAPLEKVEAEEADDAEVDPNAPVDPKAVQAPGLDASGAPKAQDTALNGAQVVAAQAIVADVGAKKLDVKSGLAMLKYFFNLTETQAQEIVGPMGTTFEPPPAAPPPAPFGGGPAMPPQADKGLPVADRGADQPAQSDKSAAVKAAAAGPFVPRRALRASEQHLNLQAMADTFDQAPDTFANAVRPIAGKMLLQAMPAVHAALEARNPSAVGDIKLDSTELDTEVGKYIEQLRVAGYRSVHGERARANPSAIRGASEEEDDYTPDASEEQSTLGSARKHLVRKITSRLTSDLEKEAIDADRTGGDASDVIARTLEFQTAKGAFKSDAALVTTKAFNVGREEFAQEHGEEIESVELSAVMDQNTCAPCEQLDGTEYAFGSDEHLEHVPPMVGVCDGGDRDRCLLVYNWKKPGSDDGEDA